MSSLSNKRRVVVTGIGALSPLGHDWPTVRAQLHSGKNVIRAMHEWKDIEGLNTQLGCTVPEFELPAHLGRTFDDEGITVDHQTNVDRVAVAVLDQRDQHLTDGDLDVLDLGHAVPAERGNTARCQAQYP